MPQVLRFADCDRSGLKEMEIAMSTPNTRYTDVAIMGTGTAGLAAYRAVKAAGLSALLIVP